jgi:hypothetical protein
LLRHLAKTAVTHWPGLSDVVVFADADPLEHLGVNVNILKIFAHK